MLQYYNDCYYAFYFARFYQEMVIQPRPQALLRVQNGGRTAILKAEKALGTRLNHITSKSIKNVLSKYGLKLRSGTYPGTCPG